MQKKKIWQNEKGDAPANALVSAAVAVLVIIIILMVIVYTGSELEGAADSGQLDDTISVSGESFNSNTLDTYVSLNHARIVSGSESVSNASTSFTTSNITSTITNESFTASNTTYVQLAHTLITNDSEVVYNASGPLTNVGNSNYTMNYTDGKILSNASGQMVHGGTYYINYTYNNVKDYAMNYTDGKINCLSTGDIAANNDYNISYNYNVRSSWGNVTDETGSLGESSASILKVGVILMVIFAAVGFLIMPYIQDALGGRRRRD